MIAIGIRVSPQTIYYSILEQQDDGTIEIKTVDTIIVPKAMDVPKRLTYIRTTLISIIAEYKVKKAGIRIFEGSSMNISTDRIYIEGVVQELFANSSVEKYFLGTKGTLAKLLEVKVTDITKWIDEKGQSEDLEIEGWETMKTESRESSLTAYAAINS
ncbi:hypothetical protein GC098_14015 [Paenibacillus sp. LMG 31458]|uniref:Uncharacterized protein n=1 Tax=Paenibacillus phytorum TaxID=2654977 RepID=A0ABX1XXT5_9BACL|nr:hypothetical protein [Paenibacillus phytorum]NOU72529.1 hypothetical protein [Paenibacillus phytorum]